MPRSPLTESINKVRRLVVEIKGTLTEDEYNLLLDELLPEPEPEAKPAKKTRKKAAGKKSARASGLGEQLGNRRRTPKINDGACAYVLGDGSICNTGDNNPIHDETFGYAAYHPFQPPAQDAAARSRPREAYTLSVANSETEQEDASNVHHAASSGD